MEHDLDAADGALHHRVGGASRGAAVRANAYFPLRNCPAVQKPVVIGFLAFFKPSSRFLAGRLRNVKKCPFLLRSGRMDGCETPSMAR